MTNYKTFNIIISSENLILTCKDRNAVFFKKTVIIQDINWKRL